MAAKKIAVGGGTRAVVDSPAIPASTIHADPNAQQSYDWSTLTINGGPIHPDLWSTMRYAYTDQGMQEANGGRPVEARSVEDILANLGGEDEVVKAARAISQAERRGLAPPIEARQILARAAGDVGVGQGEKNVERFRDGRLSSNLVLGQDPLQYVIDTYTPAGHHGMMLGDVKTARAGTVRGVLKYEPVMVKNPTTGVMERVTQGGMFLASVPMDHKIEEQAYFADINKARSQNASDKVQEAADRITAALPKPVGRSGFDGIHVDDSDAADRELDMKFAEVDLPVGI